MKNYLQSTCVAIFLTIAHVTDAIQKLVAVTPLAGSETDFFRLKKISPVSYEDNMEQGQLKESDYLNDALGPEELTNPQLIDRKGLPNPGVMGLILEHDNRAKNGICHHILTSPLFEMRQETAVDLTEKSVLGELRQNREDIFHDIVGSQICMNPYKERDVIVRGERVKEWTFRCLTRKQDDSKMFIEYFLSPIYNVTTSSTTIPGRFVFSLPANRNALAVFAIAEEPARFDNDVIKHTHQTYFNARKNLNFEEPTIETNFICGMKKVQKIRLCASIFSSNEYRDKVKFLPSRDYIEPDCQKEEIVVQVPVNFLGSRELFYRPPSFQDVRMTYREWIMGCKAINATKVGDREELLPSFYISRGYEAHTAIVYRRTLQDEYVPHEGFTNVSVITEKGVIRRVSPYTRSSSYKYERSWSSRESTARPSSRLF